MRIATVSLVLTFGMFARLAAAQSSTTNQPGANPGRPTVSTPATLTPVGYLQFESGFEAAGHSPEFNSLYTFNEVIKFAVAPRLQFLASSQPVAHFTAEGTTANRVADSSLGAQGVLSGGEGARPTLAVSYFYRIYGGAAPDFDVGSPVNSLLILASAEVKGFHYDANVFLNELVQKPVRRAQFGESLSISHLFLRRFTLSGEIWHFTQPFLRRNAIGNLWGVSYGARKTLVLDAAFDHGLTGTSTDWEVLAGFTYLLPHRLWPSRVR